MNKINKLTKEIMVIVEEERTKSTLTALSYFLKKVKEIPSFNGKNGYKEYKTAINELVVGFEGVIERVVEESK